MCNSGVQRAAGWKYYKVCISLGKPKVPLENQLTAGNKNLDWEVWCVMSSLFSFLNMYVLESVLGG